MKRVSILLTRHHDRFSRMFYQVSGRGYTHASIGFDEDDEQGTFYSFNYRGFAVENLDKFRRKGVQESQIIRLAVPDRAYELMCVKVAALAGRREQLGFSWLGIPCCLMRLPVRWRDRYFCSQFVAEVLEECGAVPLKRRSCFYLPNQFAAELPALPTCCQVVANPV